MELNEILKSPTVVIVDLRNEKEFAEAHIQDSINIPYQLIPDKIEEIKQMARPLILCCASGKDCRQAHIYLSQHGLSNTYAGGSWLELNILKEKQKA
jgi:rhodanese-related sulfurtransferase